MHKIDLYFESILGWAQYGCSEPVRVWEMFCQSYRQTANASIMLVNPETIYLEAKNE